jgi:peptide/nickel transport system permease protein
MVFWIRVSVMAKGESEHACEQAVSREGCSGRGVLRTAKIVRGRWLGGRVLCTKPLGTFGAMLILLLVCTATLAPALAPYDPLRINATLRLQPPSLAHPLGTDDFGRDILSRIIYGARVSMLIGASAAALSTLLATIMGLISGYYGGPVDTVLQRGIDALMAFPGLVVLLTIMAILGQGLGNVVLALGIGGVAGNTRLVRSAVLAVKESPYVEAARALGCPDWQIILRYILPNVAAPIIVVATLGMGAAILAESSLSFLGFGVPPSTPSWGGMLSGSGRTYLLNAPWMAISPGLAICLTVFGCNMLGDALRDVLDPKLRRGL